MMARKNHGYALRLCSLVVAVVLLVVAGCGQKESAPSAADPSPETSLRALDDSRVTDPGPAEAIPIGETGMPKVEIVVPRRLPVPYLDVCPHFYLEWEGYNPLGNEADLYYKYILIRENDLPLPPLDHEWGGAHMCPPIGLWSEWVPADCTYVTDIDLSEFLGTLEYVRTVVTAKHKSGCVLHKIFYKSYNQNRNWFRCIVVPFCASTPVHIEDQMLGVRRSTKQAEYETEIAYIYEGTEILPRFWADEFKPEGQMARAYRYYFDDPDSPTWSSWTAVELLRHEGYSPEWIARCPPDGMPFAPAIGEHEFVVEVVDYNRMVSHCEFHLEVLEGPQSQPGHLIYLVDDCRCAWLEPYYSPCEQVQDSLWAAILEGYTYEVHDTGIHYNDAVSPHALGPASTVIWSVDYDIEAGTHLLDVCSEYNNYLYSYVKTGGNLIVIGKNPIYAHAYWPNGEPWPERRATFTNLDFTPTFESLDSTTTYNFNWDVFGIVEMELPAPQVRFSTLYPCETGWSAVDAGDLPGPPYWDGVFSNGFFITEVRTDIDVHTLYGVVPLDSHGNPGAPDCTRWLVVYVPSDGVRGHAAYIGVPPWMCDHDQVRTMIRELLSLFGE
jgi:hypothetical protein